MFEQLTQRLQQAFKYVRGQHKLTENNIEQALREVRLALLEADVALPVTKAFLEDVKQKALGQAVLSQLNPAQAFIKMVHDALLVLMGGAHEALQLNRQPPVVILMAGLQGSGKTTTSAKLAYFLKNTLKKNTLLASTDIYRPAAMDQLEVLAKQAGVLFFADKTSQDPLFIAKGAMQAARAQGVDVLIIDTAGRLHVDSVLMDEIKALHAISDPVETLFVVDSMAGQDAAKAAEAFHAALPLTGVIITKAEGDARGGAALSVRYLTGKPIKFIGVGEKIDALMPFHPERIASRILGMGDILSLVEKAQQTLDTQKAEKMAKKIQKGIFNLNDYREQLLQMGKMGGVKTLMDKLPGMHALSAHAKNNLNDRVFIRNIAIINAMTPKERTYPENIRGSHKRRIAAGSGVSIPDVNQLLKQFYKLQKMMKKISSPQKLMQLMKRFKHGFGEGVF